MLDEKQQNKKLSGISASDGVVILQVIARLVGTSNIRDMELAAVGGVRDKLVASVEKATGVNFDQVRAAQQAALRRAQEEAAATQQKAAQVTAVETGNGKADDENKEVTG
jgi:hypothetical protein